MQALRAALSVLVRLLAPFIPYATAEVWSWFNDDSVHTAAWPTAAELTTPAAEADAAVLTAVSAAIIGVRGAKSEAKASQRTAVKSAVISASDAEAELLRLAAGDIAAVGRIAELQIVGGSDKIAVSRIELDLAEESA